MNFLLNIETYVRQLLPPHLRTPVRVGLAVMLYRPILGAIQALVGRFRKDYLLAGSPAQLGVLQYLLQSEVDYRIRVVEADGVRVDFRIIVPNSATIQGPVRAIVDYYKMSGMRYEIADSLTWVPGDPGEVLTWVTGYPTIMTIGSDWVIALGVTQEGTYLTRIVNQTTGTVFRNFPIQYSGGGVQFTTVNEAGVYQVEVGPLFATLTASGLQACSVIGRNPTIVSILSFSATQIHFLYDAENVFGMKWRIRQAFTNALVEEVIRVYSETPAPGTYQNNNPVYVFANGALPTGSYRLEIEGHTCASPVSVSPIFTITGTEPPPPSQDVNNPAVYSAEVGGFRYEWIPGDLVDVEVTASGLVKLINSPATRTTYAGGHTATRYLLVNEADVTDTFRDAIFGAGVQLPVGQYMFGLHYYRNTPSGGIDTLDTFPLWISQGGQELVGPSEYLLLSIFQL